MSSFRSYLFFFFRAVFLRHFPSLFLSIPFSLFPSVLDSRFLFVLFLLRFSVVVFVPSFVSCLTSVTLSSLFCWHGLLFVRVSRSVFLTSCFISFPSIFSDSPAAANVVVLQAFAHGPMGGDIQECSKKENDSVLEFSHGRLVANMRESGRTIEDTVCSLTSEPFCFRISRFVLRY